MGQGLTIYRNLAADFPDVPIYSHELARSLGQLGVTLKNLGRVKEAEEIYGQALAILTQLAADFPDDPVYHDELARTQMNLGILLDNISGRSREAVLLSPGRSQEAEKAFGQAVAIYKQLAADFHAATDHQNEVAGAMTNLARLLLARKELEGARRLLEEALPHHQAALEASPRHPAYRNFYRLNRWRLAETLLELKEHAGAAGRRRDRRCVRRHHRQLAGNVAIRSVTSAAGLQVARGTFALGAATSQIDAALTVSGGTLRLTGTTLNGTGTLTNAATVALIGNFANPATVNPALLNQGTIELTSQLGWDSDLTVSSGTLTNAVGGSIRALPLPGSGFGLSLEAQLARIVPPGTIRLNGVY